MLPEAARRRAASASLDLNLTPYLDLHLNTETV